jgi:hypothetical protein
MRTLTLSAYVFLAIGAAAGLLLASVLFSSKSDSQRIVDGG